MLGNSRGAGWLVAVSEYRHQDGSRREKGGQPGWRVRVVEQRTGKRVERTFYGSQRRARQLEAELLAEVNGGGGPPRAERLRVAEAAVQFLEAYKVNEKTGERRPQSSIVKHRDWLADVIVPGLGPQRWLDEVTRPELVAIIRDLRQKDPHTGERNGPPLAPGTKRTVGEVVSNLFKWAASEQLIATNPATNLTSGWGAGEGRVRITVPEVSEVAALATALEETAPGLGDVCWALAFTGTRISELAAIERDQVDLPGRLIHSVDTVSTHSGGRHEIRERTKTPAGVREVIIVEQFVPLVERLLAADQERCDRWQERKEKLVRQGKDLPGNAAHKDVRRLVSSPRGGYLSYSHWRRQLDIARRKTGIDLTAHQLRHVHASLLIAAGATEFELMRSLGHTSATYTRERYGHLFGSRLDELQRKASHFLGQHLEREAAPAVAADS